MKAYAVIGSNYGDEGKGLITDYLCAKNGAQFVVRFNGGAQAGHTVQLPDGTRHVFHHFGSGHFSGTKTYLGPEYIVNPMLWMKESTMLGCHELYAHPEAVVTTWHDMLFNQFIEERRGDERHGSCGVGIFETIKRSRDPKFALRVRDLGKKYVGRVLADISNDYVPKRLHDLGLPMEWGKRFSDERHGNEFSVSAATFSTITKIAEPNIMRGSTVVFEGAQGLLLDQNREDDMPYLTPSNTGLQNVIPLLPLIGVDDLETVYVTRTYLTRHGRGPLPGETPSLKFEDKTNQTNEWQEHLRFAPLDADEFKRRIAVDYTRALVHGLRLTELSTALTCVDQYYPKEVRGLPYLRYISSGPTREDVREIQRVESYG